MRYLVHLTYLIICTDHHLSAGVLDGHLAGTDGYIIRVHPGYLHITSVGVLDHLTLSKSVSDD